MAITIKNSERITSAQHNFGTEGIKNTGTGRNSFNIPKAKYNFIVHFELGEVAKQLIRKLHGTDLPLGSMTSYVISSVDLPNFTMETSTVNQYNRTRNVNGKITYDPLNMTMYDTVNSAALLLIDTYRKYYYGDFSDKSLNSWRYDMVSKPQTFGAEEQLVANELNDTSLDYSWGRSIFNMGDQDNGYFFKRIDIYEIDGSVYTVHNIHNPLIESVGFDGKDHESEGEPAKISLTFKHEGTSNICPLTKKKAIARPTAELIKLIRPDSTSEFSPMGFYKFWGEMDDAPMRAYDPNSVRGFPAQGSDSFSATSLLQQGLSLIGSTDSLISAFGSGGGLTNIASNVQKALGEGNAGSGIAGGISNTGDTLKRIGGLF